MLQVKKNLRINVLTRHLLFELVELCSFDVMRKCTVVQDRSYNAYIVYCMLHNDDAIYMKDLLCKFSVISRCKLRQGSVQKSLTNCFWEAV